MATDSAAEWSALMNLRALLGQPTAMGSAVCAFVIAVVAPNLPGFRPWLIHQLVECAANIPDVLTCVGKWTVG